MSEIGLFRYNAIPSHPGGRFTNTLECQLVVTENKMVGATATSYEWGIYIPIPELTGNLPRF